MVFKYFHANDIFALEPHNCNLILFDKPRSALIFDRFARFLIYQSDYDFERNFFNDSLQVQDELFAGTNDAFIIKNGHLKNWKINYD